MKTFLFALIALSAEGPMVSFAFHPNVMTTKMTSLAIRPSSFAQPNQQQCSELGTTRLKAEEAASSPEVDVDEDDFIAVQLEKILKEQYPSFHSLLSINENIWKTLAEVSSDITLFVPNEEAFSKLSAKRQKQWRDIRNSETAQKMGLYHVVENAALTPGMLRTEDWTQPRPSKESPPPLKIGAIVTMSGKVPVERAREGGGFFGWGGKKEEGSDIIIGPSAKIIKSFQVKGSQSKFTCIVHEMDALISPEILWRYCDQLTIPGFGN